ncbi:glycoside hydrolase family 43 protein [Saccharibacillus sp. JS10]|uniref:glycoside hydrolase family 43 protein n=1 Tax=Saccharibacillus sp. JS10 TaxID=2950552 RepID=UPI0021088FF3|nr:glycoside hydrolase family 43 protein [Saccharibacillus sp. JS10]MCQ4087863.1 glycoside hydrolase family 43 protein [Saccharibacillus sp. JS10]
MSVQPAYNAASDVQNPNKGHTLADMPVHDPFILADPTSSTYYLYSGASPRLNGVDRCGVLFYKSQDLKSWEGPYLAFTIPDGIWADPHHGAWAPEVHEYRGKYALFVTLHNEYRPLPGEPVQGYSQHLRGTAIAISDSPEGPFELVDPDRPIVDSSLMTLDGTLYIDENNDPWMVYCHEWVQTLDGTIEAVRLTEDLSAAASEPMIIMRGSEAPWLDEVLPTYVTDGCQLYRTKNGNLHMLWSSYEHGSYVQTIARSASGKLQGPWEQLAPLVKNDSGHGMFFRTWDGEWMLVLHRPFSMPDSRAYLYRISDSGDTFELA